MEQLLTEGAELCERIQELKPSGGRTMIVRGSHHDPDDRRMQERNARERAQAVIDARCRKWFYSTTNLICLLVSENNSYYSECQRLREKLGADLSLRVLVPSMYGLLQSVAEESHHGLLGEPEYVFAAESFELFLQQAKAFLSDNKITESSVLASIVLEVTVQKLLKRHSVAITEAKGLEDSINALKSRGVFKSPKAKQLKVCADVRNLALHAQFSDIVPRQVEMMIAEVDDLLANYF